METGYTGSHLAHRPASQGGNSALPSTLRSTPTPSSIYNPTGNEQISPEQSRPSSYYYETAFHIFLQEVSTQTQTKSLGRS